MHRIKKILSVFMVFSLLISFSCFSKYKVLAISNEEITAPSALLMEADSGKVIFDKDSHQTRACASITKVMTLLLIMEALEDGSLKLSDIITSSAHAASMGGSDIWLEEGESMTAEDMIKAITVASANDAAVAMAEHISGSEESFVNKMNERAKALEMNDTFFKNCNGLDEEGHVTSAYDVAIMSRELIKHGQIYNYSTVWMDTLREGKTQIVNTNKLLKSYNGAKGLKTGTTGDAGSCISAVAQRDGVTMLAVVLGCVTGSDRFDDATKLLDYGFANYTRYKTELPQDLVSSVKVKGGMQTEVKTETTLPQSLTVEKTEAKNIRCETSLQEEVQAPVKQGQILGKLSYKSGDDIISEVDIVAANSVDAINFSDVMKLMLSKMLA